ncbi:MAG: helix-turn-helix domain-containing protein [Oscillospiraceae bacterium]|nr:helix-turn-helix domain-containing protein [Oscillospiraceae bacterium]
MRIGDVIRTEREKKGMTQAALADKVHVTVQAVSGWENGKSIPDIYNLDCIANALGIGKAALMTDEMKILHWELNDQLFSPENMKRKLLKFAEEEGLENTKEAIDFAFEKHEGQWRKTSLYAKDKVPYIVHPLIMACQAHALGIGDDNVLATAMLHDVCEDCGVDPEDLPVSDSIKKSVKLLTKPEDHKDEDNKEYYRAIGEDPVAAIVKVLDRCNNVSSMMLSFCVPRVTEYIAETEQYTLPLIEKIKREYPQYSDAVFVLKYQIMSILETIKAAMLRL